MTPEAQFMLAEHTWHTRTLNVLLFGVVIALGVWRRFSRSHRYSLYTVCDPVVFSEILYSLLLPCCRWALSKRKPWRKWRRLSPEQRPRCTFLLVQPVTIYTYWFLFGKAGRALYDNQVTPPLVNSPGTAPNANQIEHTKFESQFTPNWR